MSYAYCRVLEDGGDRWRGFRFGSSSEQVSNGGEDVAWPPSLSIKLRVLSTRVPRIDSTLWDVHDVGVWVEERTGMCVGPPGVRAAI